ncbi:MAG: iron-containing alcohol dehydrogenase [Candidatus Hydrogenedentes bacterium]|nr:iron-containing alcohol dehydrogenase [Candidatus Hydrogenedentota bacterium]
MRCSWGVPPIHYTSLKQIHEERAVDLFVTDGIIDVLRGRLSFSPTRVHEVSEATIRHWDSFLSDMLGDVVYAVGGGLAVDAAKYVARKTDRPLVCIPTAISVDAFFTWASGHREDGCVRYLETKPPDVVVVDLELAGSGPLGIRSAGVTDVLSIATGRHDWKLAEGDGQNPESMPYDPSIDAMAVAILNACLACSDSAGRGEAEGLRRLVECLVLEVLLCNLVGHARPEEGSEHYFAYAAESVLGKGLPHGDLVGPGILIMAHLQGQDIAPLKKAMKACNVPLTNVPPNAIRTILQMLPDYCVRHKLPYGIAHTLTDSQVRSFDPGILE